jgi:exopolyphosphatase/guanosine-5'-triphosphate,3'-diphosphate pyrophosphatase
MRLAAIDIGTNSVHMIVVRVRPDLSFEVIDREKEMVRLGAGGLDGRELAESAVTAALQALAKFRRIAESHRVDEVLAAATSATREARNGGEFLAAIARDTGIRPRVISGTEEARLIHLAAVYGVDVTRGAAVVIDIGGGSVEITLGDSQHMQLGRSFKVGVIRVTERFVTSDPLTRRDEHRLVRHLTSQIGAYARQVAAAGFDRVIGTSGTILSLGAVAAQAQTGETPPELRNLRVPAREIHRLRKHLVALTLAERLRIPGLEPKRADIAVAGAVLLDTILRALGAEEITLCDLALREGLVLDYIHRNRQQIAQVDRYPDIRRRSVVELAERCNYFAPHARQVASLATKLFDQTRGLHGFTDREREWLEYASLMHDLGVHISYEKHHRHSYYLIKHGDLRGFDPEEIEIIGLVARYHRQGLPKKTHAEFGALSRPRRRTVRALASMLRLAEGLDRSHSQPIAGLALQDRGEDLLVELQASGDAELEHWAAPRHAAAFEELVGRTVRFEMTGAPADPAAPPSVARVTRPAVRRRRRGRPGEDIPPTTIRGGATSK